MNFRSASARRNPSRLRRSCRTRCWRARGAVLALLIVRVAAAGEPCSVTPSETWKLSVDVMDESFARQDTETARWVKFTILSCSPDRVYFQDSREYAFHYDFAREHLDPLAGMTRPQFDAVTLHAAGQQAVLGAVLLAPLGRPEIAGEFGIQLIRQDPFAREELASLVETVRERVNAPDGARTFYFPAFEQEPSARTHAAWLAERGIVVSSTTRWARDDLVYAEGWALGRLTFVESGAIDAAYRDGRLRASDILLTDGVPAEIPFVAGVVSLAPSTPNSHVAILASNFGVPFAHPIEPRRAGELQALAGRRIVLRAYDDAATPNLRVDDIEDVLSEEAIDEILLLKELPPLELVRKRPAGVYVRRVAGLRPADIDTVGGKAANYSSLLASLPGNTRTAFALTFDVWDAFLGQDYSPGRTLREEIAARLGSLSGSFPPEDPAALANTLAGIRHLFEDEGVTEFPPAARAEIIGTLSDPRSGLDPTRKIRFRSSTNVEDGDLFSGAGLYESRSGCLADDIDGDGVGPSICDRGDQREKGVFRAIRKVFASFYAENAYLERLRWGVNENDVGMAVLVHHSFPDETELANGVATLTRRADFWEVLLVSQIGATSVTNPEDGSLPEEVTVNMRGDGTRLSILRVRRRSTLVLLGETVLEWKDDYNELARLLVTAADRFADDIGLEDGILDFEYKKITGEGLVVKQVRQVPAPSGERSITPFLLPGSRDLEVFQGEFSNVLSNHRLKSFWKVDVAGQWLTEENVEDSFYSRVDVTLHDGCEFREISGHPSELPGAEHSLDGRDVLDGFRLDDLANPRTYTLVTPSIPLLVAPSESPVLTIDDIPLPALRLDHEEAVTVLSPSLEPAKTREEEIRLASPEPASKAQTYRSWRLDAGEGIEVETSYWWPAPPPPGVLPPKTAPLARWDRTLIRGLAAEPILLTDPFAQTYRPAHHNFSEGFVFEPALDPGVPDEVAGELRKNGTEIFHVFRWIDGRVTFRAFSRAEVGHGCACDAGVAGDMNGDARTDVSDGVFLLLWLFSGGEAPRAPDRAVDMNSDGRVDIADPMHLLQYLFGGGPPPASPCAE